MSTTYSPPTTPFAGARAPAAPAFDLAIVTDVATAVYTEEELAAKYHVELPVLRAALDNPVFKQQVEQAKVELTKSGFLTKTRAKSVINEDLITKLQDIIYDLDSNADDIVKAGHLLLKLAGLDVKEPAAQETGQKMPTIQINLMPTSPAPGVSPPSVTLEGSVVEVAE